MRKCESCSAIEGVSYIINGGTLCYHCSYLHDLTGMWATYLGMDNGKHKFRIHKSFICLGCHIRLTHVDIDCTLDSYGEELRKLFHLPIMSEIEND